MMLNDVVIDVFSTVIYINTTCQVFVVVCKKMVLQQTAVLFHIKFWLVILLSRVFKLWDDCIFLKEECIDLGRKIWLYQVFN